MLVLALFLLAAQAGYCAENSVVSMRKRFLQESGNIKPLLKNSRDVVLLSTLWDSCFIVMTQLDAYVSMVGIIDTVKRQDLQESAVDYLVSWLGEVKNTNNAALASLNSVGSSLDQATIVVVKRMKGDFADLNKILEAETVRLIRLKEGIRKKILSLR